MISLRQAPHWSCKAAVLVASIATILVAVNAHAQPFYPQNPLGQFLNGLGANIARQQAIEAARQAWSSVDPTMYQCLMRTLSPAPPVLANSGISPGDPRLQPYFQRCAAAIAQANVQREAAAREAAEEQQREQAAREAQQAEQLREEAEARMQALAATKAQQAEEQRRILEQRTEKAVFTQVQAMPELSAYINRAEPALIFLYVPTSRRLMRTLDGKVSSVGEEEPVVCWAFPTTGAASADFFLWSMKRLEAITHAKQFSLAPCADVPNYGSADVVLFATTDLMQANAEKALELGKSIGTGRLSVLLEARQKEYDAKIAADQKEQQDLVARAKARAAKVESAIDVGTEQGVAVLMMQTGSDGPVCTIEPVDFDIVKQAVATSGDQQMIKQLAGFDAVTRLSANDAFIEVKSGQCGVLAGDVTSLRDIRTALKRDSFSAGTGFVWVAAADFKAAEAVVAQRRQEQEKAKELAKEKAVEKAASEQAQEQAAATAAAAEKAKAIAKERAATDASSQLINHP
jgi:hypothetical protein